MKKFILQFLTIIIFTPSIFAQDRPVYFFVPYNANYDCRWSPSQLDTNASCLLKHIQLMTSHNMNGNYYFTGLSADYLYNNHREILDTMSAQNLPYSHHGANRPPNPPPNRRVTGLFWNTDVDSIWEYEKDSLRCNGILDPTKIGGLKKMQQVIFKTNPLSTGRFFQASILYVTKVYGATQMVGLKGNTGAPSGRAWFLGMLNRPDSTGWSIDPQRFKDWALYNRLNLIRYLDSLVSNRDRTNFNFIGILMHDTDFWKNLTQAQKNSMWAHYDTLMRWAETNPEVKPIVLTELWNLAIDDRNRNFSKQNLSVVADSLVSIITRNPSPYSLPVYLTIQGAEPDYLSLADSYQALLYSLSDYNRTGRLPDSVSIRDILGPTVRTSLIAKDTFNLSGTTVVERASQVADTLRDRIPHSLSIFPGMQDLDASEFLYAMAQVYQNIYWNGNPGNIRLKDVSPYTFQSLNNTLADTLTKLQFWTYKPTRWKPAQTGVEEQIPNFKSQIPNFALFQNSPNPFSKSTMIKLQIPKGVNSTLKIYDITGKLVYELPITQLLNYPITEFEFNGKDSSGKNLPSGIYFYRITSGSFTETKKMVLLR